MKKKLLDGDCPFVALIFKQIYAQNWQTVLFCPNTILKSSYFNLLCVLIEEIEWISFEWRKNLFFSGNFCCCFY